MKQLDLGALGGELLLFGGPYSNYQATQALKAQAEQLQIPPSNIICTGDIVAYCSQPNETIELLREWGVHIVMGNCEESLGWNANDCGCGFEEGSACDTLSNDWYAFAVRHVKQIYKEWMRTLPSTIYFNFLGKRFAVLHGGVEQINQFIFPSTKTELKKQQITGLGVDGVIGGHSGLPFTQIIDNKLWHNPGVIGMPANDGTNQTWYSRWQPREGNIKIKHCHLQYDASGAKQHMVESGLDNGYTNALMSGLWPSMDVLPETERRQQGKTINEMEIVYHSPT